MVLLLVVMAMGLTSSARSRRYMAGLKAGVALQCVFALVFARQTYRSYGVPHKADRLPLFVVMTLGSVAFLSGAVQGLCSRLRRPRRPPKDFEDLRRQNEIMK